MRSGPTQHRQSAQKQTTETPLVRTLSTVKSKKDIADEKETKQTSTPTPSATLIGVPPTSTNETALSTSSVGVKDVFLGVPEMDNLLLPDLGLSKEPTREDVINQLINTEPTQEVNTTEDELDTADALLSLSNTREIGSNLDTDFGMEDNALLIPIGGQAICEDIAPTESRLGQIEVDSEIAHIIDAEEQPKLNTAPALTPLLGVQDADTTNKQLTTTEQEQSTTGTDVTKDPDETSPLIGVQSNEQPAADPSPKPPKTTSGAQPKSTDPKKQTGMRGAFKSQLYGLRRKVPKDRAYKCQICGKSKRSMEALNEHHRGRHDPQKCGVCRKVFDLVTSLSHHMYSHYTRKFHCEKCNFHCFFQSELESHKIVHRERPTYQCQYPKC